MLAILLTLIAVPSFGNTPSLVANNYEDVIRQFLNAPALCDPLNQRDEHMKRKSCVRGIKCRDTEYDVHSRCEMKDGKQQLHVWGMAGGAMESTLWLTEERWNEIGGSLIINHFKNMEMTGMKIQVYGLDVQEDVLEVKFRVERLGRALTEGVWRMKRGHLFQQILYRNEVTGYVFYGETTDELVEDIE